jgi:hypothetical protein
MLAVGTTTTYAYGSILETNKHQEEEHMTKFPIPSSEPFKVKASSKAHNFGHRLCVKLSNCSYVTLGQSTECENIHGLG